MKNLVNEKYSSSFHPESAPLRACSSFCKQAIYNRHHIEGKNLLEWKVA